MNAFREMFSAKYGREIVEIYFVKTQMHKTKVAWVPPRILGLKTIISLATRGRAVADEAAFWLEKSSATGLIYNNAPNAST